MEIYNTPEIEVRVSLGELIAKVLPEVTGVDDFLVEIIDPTTGRRQKLAELGEVLALTFRLPSQRIDAVGTALRLVR